MPRIDVHDPTTAPDGAKPYLEGLEKKYGTTLNIFGQMATSPALLRMFVDAETALAEDSSLGEDIRQALHLTVAQVNDCEYCQAAYTGASKAAGWSEEQTVQIRRGEVDGDGRTTALLAFARELTEKQGWLTDSTWHQALDAGWSEEQLLEAFGEVLRTLMTNWFNHMTGTELDLPEAPSLG
jgi:AhpD family alkylhydroperoxidase